MNETGAAWLDAVKWDAEGLVPAVAQDATSGRILMLAWMNREALELTAAPRARRCTGRARAGACGAKARNPGMSRRCARSAWIATATPCC